MSNTKHRMRTKAHSSTYTVLLLISSVMSSYSNSFGDNIMACVCNYKTVQSLRIFKFQFPYIALGLWYFVIRSVVVFHRFVRHI